MYKTIMVPFTDWRFDSRAVSAAVKLARRSAARLHIVHVRDANLSRAARVAEDEAFHAAIDYAGDEMNESVSFRILTSTLSAVRTTRIAEGLADYVRQHDIDLVVMARRKHSASRLLLGSVGERLLALIDRSVLFVPVRSRNLRLNHPRLLLPLDGSQEAEAILPVTASLAILTGGSVRLLRVVAPAPASQVPVYHQDGASEEAVARALDAQRYLDRIAEQLNRSGVYADTKVLFGEPVSDVVQQLAGKDHVDLIAVASHRVPGRLVFAAEGVTAHVLHHFDTAVLVRPQQNRARVEAHDLAGVA